MNSPLVKKLLTYIGIPLLFLVVLVVYFNPAFSGKVIVMGDIVQFQGMAHETEEFRKETGEEALWTTSMFGGMPAYQISTIHKNNVLRYLDKLFHFGLPRPADYIFVMFCGFFFLLVVLDVNPWLSAVAAMGFAFSSYFFIILVAGHTSKANAIAYLAPAVAGVFVAYRGKYLLGLILFAVFMGMEIYANHYQITYYLAFLLAFISAGFLIDSLIKKTFANYAKANAALLVGSVLALLPNLGALWTTYQYADLTMRGKAELQHVQAQASNGNKTSGLEKEYALRWSYGVGETFTLLVPNYNGGGSGSPLPKSSETFKVLTDEMGVPESSAEDAIKQWPTYWGDQPFTSGPVYAGAVICFLFVLGMFIVEEKSLKWTLFAATVFTVMLSWGRNFAPLTDIFFDHFPMYNKFRTPSMWLVIAEFTMPLLGALALNRLFTATADERTKMVKPLLMSAGIVGGLALLLGLAAPMMLDFRGENDAAQFAQMLKQKENSAPVQSLVSALEADRASMLRSDALRAFGFILAAAALLWLFLKGTVKQLGLVAAGLAVLVMADMLPVNLRYLNKDNFESKGDYDQRFEPSKAGAFILQSDKDPNYRVLNLATNTFNETTTSYHLKSIGGYHAAKLRRYQDLIDFHIDPEMRTFIQTLNNKPTDSSLRATLATLKVLNMLNTRYIIYNNDAQPIQNRFAYGNAWFIREVKFAKDADTEIEMLKDIYPLTTAVVAESQQSLVGNTAPAADPTASIRLTKFAPNKISYESNASSDQIAVFSEIYYADGWNAYLDGKLVPHFRANYVLRAMKVPAGKHSIEFRFEPKAYAQGETIALVASILLALVVLGGGFLIWKKK